MKLFLSWFFGLTLALFPGGEAVAASRPNIVLIMADDMGYSDIGCYGSEIPTPHLDALAAGGLRFTGFYNTARCSPTRAALLTGLHPHQAGMGRLAEDDFGATNQPPPGYLGHLNNKCLTMAEALRPAGYKTWMAGKWHLGMRNDSKWPLQRGFDRFYGLLTGASSYLMPDGVRGLTLDNKQIPAPENPDYYTTDAFTDFAVKQITDHTGDAPFFLYLAFTAPHWPLHARPDDIAKFTGKYRAGWDALRTARLARQKELGVVKKDEVLSPRDAGARAWESLTETEKEQLDYRMAVYAAQVHRMDYNVGKVVSVLREKKIFENTLLVFLADNGGCAEPYTDIGGQPAARINDPAFSGNVSYGTGWANASNTPFRKFKSTLYEGGIATPLIVSWPSGLKSPAGGLNSTPGYLTDLMPTFLEAAGASWPKEKSGEAVPALEGRSLMPILTTGAPLSGQEDRVFCWEQYGYQAVRQGNLKAILAPAHLYDRSGRGQWELYDLSSDRTESKDLAAQRPDELKSLIAHWDAWAARAQVFPTPGARKPDPAK